MNMDDNKGNKEISARDVWREKNRKHSKNGMYHYRGKDGAVYGENIQSSGRKFGKPSKPVMIFGVILIGCLLLGLIMKVSGMGAGLKENSPAAATRGDHIGVLYIEGTIMADDENYNHQYALDTIEGMMENGDNQGLMLYVNTPGGGVYESDELYLKIKEYQETTGRPVYSYMASQATSGGYYISASADRILANRNCWTGSIGVTMGTMFDISEFLEKHGISSKTITSGPNKAMGSMTNPLTEQQQDIMQSMVDEAYEQFVGIVADGRKLDIDYVRSIADGRIYTAMQAKNVKLVDDVVKTYDEAVENMKNKEGLSDCDVAVFRYVPPENLFTGLIEGMDKLAESKTSGDISAIVELIEKQNEMPLQYMCEVKK